MVNIEDVHVGDWLTIDTDLKTGPRYCVIDLMLCNAGKTFQVSSLRPSFHNGETYIKLKSDDDHIWSWHPDLLSWPNQIEFDASDIDIMSFTDDFGI